jgi:tetratricopeptide (TPR) repeat protein
MQRNPEVLLIGAVAAFAVTGAAALMLHQGEGAPIAEPPIAVVEPAQPGPAAGDAESWFARVRPSCNAVEVDTRMRIEPAPTTPDGGMYEAACYALAGRTERSREIIDLLPSDQRVQAAGVVFEAGHPAADAGDDIAAGPLMELVVDYWPNHYMALYHAGAARYELGDYALAKKYLERFMAEYGTEDGWRGSARGMLERIAEGPSNGGAT